MTTNAANQRRKPAASSPAAGVSLAFALGTASSRAATFRTAMTALLHAGCSLGHDQPGHVVSSYDAQGEHYAAPLLVPIGANPTLPQALDILTGVEQRYNRTIGFGLIAAEVSLPVTCRIYDEARTLAVRLDLGAPTWAQLVRVRRSRRAATSALLEIGRTLFTLLPTDYLLLGPTTLLHQVPREPDAQLIRRTPVLLVAAGALWAQRQVPRIAQGALAVEEVPGGNVVVRAWDASAAVPPDSPPSSASRRV